MLKFILMILVSSSSFAASWKDLDLGQDYKLAQSIQLIQKERSGSLLDLSKGEKLTLLEIEEVTLSGSDNVLLYVFHYPNCPGRAMTSEMEIVPVQGTFPVVKTGALLEKCELKFYVKNKDYNSQNLFE